MIMVTAKLNIEIGKSSVGKWIHENFNIPVIDADLLGHRAYLPGTECFKGVVATFGTDVVDANGNIDRKALGGKVFGNKEEMKKLTDLVYPEIQSLAVQEFKKLAESTSLLCFFEAAVLIEAGWSHLVNELWVVIVEPETAIARLMNRNKIDETAAKARLSSQITNEERTAVADVVIENNGSIEELLAKLQELLASKFGLRIKTAKI